MSTISFFELANEYSFITFFSFEIKVASFASFALQIYTMARVRLLSIHYACGLSSIEWMNERSALALTDYFVYRFTYDFTYFIQCARPKSLSVADGQVSVGPDIHKYLFFIILLVSKDINRNLCDQSIILV